MEGFLLTPTPPTSLRKGLGSGSGSLWREPEFGPPPSTFCVPRSHSTHSLAPEVLRGEGVEPSPPPAHSSCQSAVWMKDLKPRDNCGQLSPAPPPAPALPSSPLLSDRALLRLLWGSFPSLSQSFLPLPLSFCLPLSSLPILSAKKLVCPHKTANEETNF